MNRIGIDDLEPVADQCLARDHQRLGLERRVERVRSQRRAHRRDHRRGIGELAFGPRDQRPHHQFLQRLEPRERVAVDLGQALELARPPRHLDDHRRREVAVDRQQRHFADILERHHVAGPIEPHDPLLAELGATRLIDQRDLEGDHHRLLVALPRRVGNNLRQMQRRGRCRGVMLDPRGHLGRPRLAVPQAELLEVGAARLLDRIDEIVAGYRFAVVALEVEIGALAERLGPDQRPHHPDHFGALVVNRRGVEIGDLDIAVGTHRMRQRA